MIKFFSVNAMVPIYGIAARLPPSFTHHSSCFALSGDWYEPEVDVQDKHAMIAGKAAVAVTVVIDLLPVFREAFRRVKCSTSLTFSHILKLANAFCAEETFLSQR